MVKDVVAIPAAAAQREEAALALGRKLLQVCFTNGLAPCEQDGMQALTTVCCVPACTSQPCSRLEAGPGWETMSASPAETTCPTP